MVQFIQGYDQGGQTRCEQGLTKSKCPKKLWTDCLERQAYIRSFIAHDVFALKGETHDTLANGKTPDISEFVTFKW